MEVSKKSGSGRLGFGIVGGDSLAFEVYRNRVVQGCMVNDSTTGSSQLAGTGNGTYLYDITQGLVMIDGYVLEVAAAADQALEAAGDILDTGQSIVYSIVYYRSIAGGDIRLRVFKGTPATTGSQVAPTDAEIEALLGEGTVWFTIAEVTIARTADTTVTEAQDNTVRPTLMPVTVHQE